MQNKTKVKRVKCAICNKEFIWTKYNRKYCCSACKKEAMKATIKKYNKKRVKQPIIKEKESITLICPICNKEFTTQDKRKKYCSNTCKEEAKKLYIKKFRTKKIESIRKYNREKYHEKHPLYEKHCKICGKLFTPSNSNREIYCSNTCKEISKKLAIKKYLLSEKGKIASKKASNKYAKTEKGKARSKKYFSNKKEK